MTGAEAKSETDRPTRSRGRPTSDDAAEIESQLLAAALAEFSREGYGGASMRGIAKAANVARTTLQARYESKEALFKAIMTRQIATMSAVTSLASEGPPDLKAGLKAYANRALSVSLEGEYLEVNRLIYGSANQFPEVAAAAIESTRLGIEQITRFIEHCARADGVPCRRPDLVAENFILLLRGWYGHAFLHPASVTRYKREEWVDRTVEALVGGRAAW